MKHAIRKIHFIGVGGSGMSGIAEVLLNLGYQISGSDLSDSATLGRLASLGIATHVGHSADNVKDADAVVTSTAVKADNPEVLAARERHIPIVPRAVMLAELMRMKQGVAIAGTHGKTTTTSLVASVLGEAGLDPTFVIGGRLNSAGANAKLGTGDYIVVEADESDASFLNLLPVMAVVTNIDADHMETYGHDLGKLKGAFVEFLHRMPFYGTAIVCSDDPGVQSILHDIARPVTTYGLNEGAQVRAVDVQAEQGQMRFTVQRRNGVTMPDLPLVLNLPGHHNVLNALAAVAVAVELGVEDAAVQRALANFKGVGRRFQRYGEVAVPGSAGHFTVIDDYGHHPVEMAATLAAARGAFPGRRLVLAFQPHRFSRTRDCFEDFVKVIGQGCDSVLLAEVYAAGEAPIVAADGRSLARALRVAGKVEPIFVDSMTDMPQAVLRNARDGDVLICMGAGSIGAVPAQLLQLGGGCMKDLNLGKVAVLMGGQSAEREVSLMSGQGVLQALLASGVEAYAFDPAERDLGELQREGFDRCFIALHGRFGEDGTVQGALELMGLPYTGSGVMASSIAMDKTMTKRVWLAEGLPTPRYVLVRREQLDSVSLTELVSSLGLPMIVKPAREGSSIGVTKVTQVQDLFAALQAAAHCDADILCEQCIVGDEVTCPVLGEGDLARALPMIRIVAPEGNYDYQNKYFTNDTQYLVPCGLPAAEEAAIEALIVKAYQVLGCRGWGRIDVMIDAATRQPYLLEINTSPGMTGHSLVPMSAKAAGISYPELCCQLLASAALDHVQEAQG